MPKNDKPSSLRRGHGYKEAQEQGMPWALISRDDNASVRRLNNAQKTRAALNHTLAELKKKLPRAEERAATLKREGQSDREIIDQLKIEALESEKRHAVVRDAKRGK